MINKKSAIAARTIISGAKRSICNTINENATIA